VLRLPFGSVTVCLKVEVKEVVTDELATVMVVPDWVESSGPLVLVDVAKVDGTMVATEPEVVTTVTDGGDDDPDDADDAGG